MFGLASHFDRPLSFGEDEEILSVEVNSVLCSGRPEVFSIVSKMAQWSGPVMSDTFNLSFFRFRSLSLVGLARPLSPLCQT